MEISTLDVTMQEPRRIPGRPKSRGFSEFDRKLGAYKPDLPEALLERFSGFLSDEDYLSLVNEIAMVRTLFSHMVQEWKDFVEAGFDYDSDKDPPKPPFKVSELLSGAEQISKLVERQHKILYSDANLITVEAAVAFSLAVSEAVNVFVKDPQERANVLAAMRKMLVGSQSFNVSTQISQRILSSTPPSIDGTFEVLETIEEESHA